MAAFCPYLGECGGCQSADQPYVEQVAQKEQRLRQLFTPLGTALPWQPFIPMPDHNPRYFRNKIRFGFVWQNDRLRPSRHRPGEAAAELPVESCYLQSPFAYAAAEAVAAYAQNMDWPLFDKNSHGGWLKHILIREGKHTGAKMVCLVVNQGREPDLADFIDWFCQRFPDLTSFYYSATAGRNNERRLDQLLWGQPVIEEKVGDYLFHISPTAFFQTNSVLLRELYDQVGTAAALTEKDSLWDLYAGSATIGIYLSRFCRTVLSVENNAANLADARLNLEANKVNNLRLLAGRVEEVVDSRLVKEVGRPDVVVVDPPRAGLSATALNLVLGLRTDRLVYVSCNPESALNDLRQLCQYQYRISRLVGLDCFPWTNHCEMVVQLRLK